MLDVKTVTHNSQKRKQGDWSGLVDKKEVPMLSSKDKDDKVLDVKTVTHNFRKRKLVLLEDGNVYKIKKVETGRSGLTTINIALKCLACTYCITVVDNKYYQKRVFCLFYHRTA